MSTSYSIDITTARNLAIILIHLMLFATAGLDKFKSLKTPEWFVKPFANTLIAKMPGGAAAGYWMIAIFELALTAMFLAALVRLEFVTGNAHPILSIALTAALFLYSMLGLGLRLTSDFQGSANMFTYFGVTLISLYLVSI